MDYTRRDLAQAVLDAHPDSKRGLDMYRGGFNEEMKKHQVRMRDGLLIRKLEGSGVLAKVDEIYALNKMSAKVHLDIVEEVLGLVDSPVHTVTTEDLTALGVNDTPPNSDDYEIDY